MPRRLRTETGQVIDGTMVAALSAEAEAGYDPSTFRPSRRVGRPSLGAGNSPRLQFRVDRVLYERVLAKAQAEHRTLSDIARGLLEEYVR